MKFWFLTICTNASHKKRLGLHFGLGLHLHPYFVYASREGSSEPVHMPRFA